MVEDVPPHYGFNSIRALFECFGVINDVIIPGVVDNDDLQSLSVQKRRAFIVYESSSSIAKAFAFDASIVQPYIDEFALDGILCGMSRWKNIYKQQHPSHEELQDAVDSFMSIFDNQQDAIAKSLREGKVVDDDGFVLVQSKKKRKVIPTKKFTDIKPTKGQGKLVNDLFYGFNRKSEKKEQLDDLRRQFEEDKLRAEEMKRRMKFTL